MLQVFISSGRSAARKCQKAPKCCWWHTAYRLWSLPPIFGLQTTTDQVCLGHRRNLCNIAAHSCGHTSHTLSNRFQLAPCCCSWKSLRSPKVVWTHCRALLANSVHVPFLDLIWLYCSQTWQHQEGGRVQGWESVCWVVGGFLVSWFLGFKVSWCLSFKDLSNFYFVFAGRYWISYPRFPWIHSVGCREIFAARFFQYIEQHEFPEPRFIT